MVVFPAPRDLVRLLLHRIYHLYHHFQRACWPAPVWAVLCTQTLCISHVFLSGRDSWFRSGPVASALWDADERFLGALGVSALLPTYLRIAYLAGYSSLASMLVVALASKLTMRMLLKYQTWMFERKPSVFTVLWALALKAFYLGQRSPSTYCFQNSIPRLPVPRLSDTIWRYLQTVEPVLSHDQFVQATQDAILFEKSALARRCQALLVMRSWVAGNWVSDLWEKVVYLRSRSVAAPEQYIMRAHYPVGCVNVNKSTFPVLMYMWHKLPLDLSLSLALALAPGARC